MARQLFGPLRSHRANAFCFGQAMNALGLQELSLQSICQARKHISYCCKNAGRDGSHLHCDFLGIGVVQPAQNVRRIWHGPILALFLRSPARWQHEMSTFNPSLNGIALRPHHAHP